ncbi:WecB/TagA/CpsF family glycosyltransferase [Rhodococcus sp. BP-332]|uniref:WecB/TagA/CpsF family glycosyltransferase n=1 Tax=Rhodococcus sp. BP-332 TaxID=2739447 RepID=UPI0035ABA903
MRRGSRDAQVVRGPSLFSRVVRDGRQEGFSHFLLGTTPDTLRLLTQTLESRYEGVAIAGIYAPPFAPLDESFIADCAVRINATDAAMVWVGLGTPKQDFLADQLAALTGRPCLGVGAAFDFVSGVVPESPKWLHGTGFEWLYRLAKEPRRLGKRYMIGNLQFIKAVLFPKRTS